MSTGRRADHRSVRFFHLTQHVAKVLCSLILPLERGAAIQHVLVHLSFIKATPFSQHGLTAGFSTIYNFTNLHFKIATDNMWFCVIQCFSNPAGIWSFHTGVKVSNIYITIWCLIIIYWVLAKTKVLLYVIFQHNLQHLELSTNSNLNIIRNCGNTITLLGTVIILFHYKKGVVLIILSATIYI